ncbi:MAG: hypothetical protein M3509_10025, partial [Chloroflexota bacterium]|nr:hypothetical protein [Chloroflexota bacterium]
VNRAMATLPQDLEGKLGAHATELKAQTALKGAPMNPDEDPRMVFGSNGAKYPCSAGFSRGTLWVL